MLTRRIILALPATLALGKRSWAETLPLPAADPPKAPEGDPVDINADLEEQIQKWIETSGYGERDGKDLSVVHYISPVTVPSTNPDWVRFRMLAYTEALLEAQANYVARQMTTTLVNTVKELAKGSDNPPPYQDVRTPGQAADVVRKVLAVAGGKLDGELRDMGVDPRQYEQTPDTQKTELLRNHLKKTTVRRSFGSLAGMMPVKTFEGQDGAKNYQIGVVAVVSPLMADFARQVMTYRGQFTPDRSRARNLSDLYKDKATLLHDFGVRKTYDDQGLPVIVSFSQWGSAYRGSDAAIAATYRDTARRQASTEADSQIVDFLKGSATYDQTSITGQELGQIASTLPDSTSVEDVKALIDQRQSTIKRTSAAQIIGMRTLYSWTGKHPASDTPIVGVIRMWSAASEQGVRALRDGQAAQSTVGSTEEKRDTPSVTQSRSLMDSSDF
jgi:hypothetical protein